MGKRYLRRVHLFGLQRGSQADGNTHDFREVGLGVFIIDSNNLKSPYLTFSPFFQQILIDHVTWMSGLLTNWRL